MSSAIRMPHRGFPLAACALLAAVAVLPILAAPAGAQTGTGPATTQQPGANLPLGQPALRRPFGHDASREAARAGVARAQGSGGGPTDGAPRSRSRRATVPRRTPARTANP